MKKNITIFKVLLVVYILLLLYPYVQPLFSSSEMDEYRYMQTPMDIFFERKFDFGSIEKSNTPSFDFSELKHPFESTPFLLQLFLTALLIIGIIRFFKSRYQRNTILLFALITKYWLLIATFIYQCSQRIFLSLFADQDPTIQKMAAYDFIPIMTFHLLVLHGLVWSARKLIPAEDALPSEIRPASGISRAMAFFSERLLVTIPLLYSIFFIVYYIQRTRDYTFAKHFSNIDEQMVRNIFLLCIELIIFICYAVIESSFRTSPLKVLNGTAVIKKQTGEMAGVGSVIVKTFCRLIPLDSISFFFSNGWHDAISNTTTAYVSTENWLHRHARIGRWMFSIFLSLYIWICIHGILHISSHSSNFNIPIVGISSLVALLILFISTSMWLAASVHYIYTRDALNETGSNVFFWKSLSIWIPFVNLVTLRSMLTTSHVYLQVFCPDSPHIETLRKRSGTVSLCFFIFYYLFLWSVRYFFTGRKWDFIGTSVFLALGLIICLIPLIRYAGILRKVAADTQLSDTPVSVTFDKGAFL